MIAIIGAVIVGLVIIGLITLSRWIMNSYRRDMSYGLFFGVIITMFFLLEIRIVSDIIANPKPTAMDVYRGKTTLEYTIRDGVKIDSIVVFKDSIYGK